jgi:energy-coupling factor transporter ATP-binding protein EcfA2
VSTTGRHAHDHSSDPTGEVLVEFSGYSFQYRAQADPTLHDVDLTVRRGEKIVIVGASGSGKSTLLRAIDGLIPHRYQGSASGTVRVCGTDPSAADLVETSQHVGTVLQDVSGQFVALTVAEDIAFSLENQQVPTADMPERVRRAAERVDIDDKLGSAPQELSGGQKQRVAIAGVLVDDVDVLLFDEPLAMLDPASGHGAIELIDDLHRHHGATVIMVEHRLEDVLHRDVDRIVLMDHGRIVADGPPDEIVASGLLERSGIRPPLHVAALRYAGAPLSAQQRPSRAETIGLTDAQVEAVRAWVAGEDPAAPAAPTAPPAPPAPTERPMLTLDRVGVVLGAGPRGPGHPVLSDLDALIRPGEMLAIVGSNGAGKSTLARAICGFEQISAGAILLQEQDVADWPLARRGEHIGFVLQEPGQMLSTPTVREEVDLGLVARGYDRSEIDRRQESALRVCGLWPMRSWPVSALSHGQKKRLTIACMLAIEPEVLILDEPTAGQDFAHYTEFMDFLAGVNAAGTTVLLITHDMHLALEYTDRVLVLSEGRLLADAAPADVLTDPDVTRRADLVTTGLYTLARQCGIEDPSRLVRRFVADDRAARRSSASPAAPDPSAGQHPLAGPAPSAGQDPTADSGPAAPTADAGQDGEAR